ncbi:MAG TPA: tyrosine-type recombinase/integrase, partial [Clostridiaceae bacterium]|nr:tyrosine-type recombinase/integrase [Clostridiaceae bacterium]
MSKNFNPKYTFPLLEQYFTYIEAIRGSAKSTITEYRYDLRLFFRYLKKNRGLVKDDIPFNKITIDDIDLAFIQQVTLTECYGFLSYLTRERNAASSNRARKVASIKGFFKYLKGKAGLIDLDPTVELESPRHNKKLPVYLELNEAKALLNAADNVKNTFAERDYCILTLFLNCGLRLAELCQINVGDIKEDTLRVIGKGNKERTVYLNAACIEAIEAYLAIRPTQKLTEPDALFISSRGNRMS